jgi:hypothetical protein
MKPSVHTCVSLFLCLCLFLLSLSSCGVKLEETGQGAKDNGNGITYTHASVVYEPVEMGSKYGKLKVTDSMSLELYRIEGLDPEQWLATEDGNVLYADSVSLPTLTDMQPSALQICVDGTTVHVLRRISDAETVNAMVTAWEEGVSVPYTASTPLKTYKIRFESTLYPSLYYSVTYVEYSSDQVVDEVNYGKYFLYSSFDGIFVPAGDALHLIISDGEDETADTQEAAS